MLHDDQDSLIDNWHDRQDFFMKKFARRAGSFFKRLDTTGKILLQQIWQDGQDTFTKNITRRERFFEKLARLARFFYKKNSNDRQDFYDIVSNSPCCKTI